ncbi:YfiR family protein [Candidatus Methylobacter oryzae]|uniref:YfiR family protein n=1 Tax=Candidatus Methylobacter oryzae TaxID=2497749 RepID=A0ABY3CDU3_9GAMM|nr:YfiR family protein [Candidatus Methylobacter oryzae]TRW95025.1 YfiR family protein [Candidatus Methylobacter oryzae]
MIRISIAVWALLVTLLAGAVADEATEYDLKAAYLLNFAAYVEWPSPPKPVTVCVYGNNPFKAATIAALLNAKSGQIDAVFKYPRQLEYLTVCNILFWPQSEQGNFGKATALLNNAPILIVTDVQDGLPQGAMINLITESKHLRFEINIGTVLASKLKISSKLLKLAKIVS